MAWMTSMPLSAQGLSFGVKGGFDVVSMEFNNDVFDQSNRLGYFIGPTFVIPTMVPGLSIDISALYNQRTLKVDEESINQQSLAIPVHIRYGASIIDFGSVFLTAGPQLSFNIGKSKMTWQDVKKLDKTFALQDTKVGMDFGVGASIGHHLEAIVYYYVPIGRTADIVWNEVDASLNTTMKSTHTTSNSWFLSVAYIF
jgi:hypothetical protein